VEAYVRQLLADLDQELLEPAARRALVSIFIGGGTPSLFPGAAIAALLDGIRARTELSADCEISLEANPGTADARHFAAYRAAGVNRLSLGVQSLSAPHLERLGRIHDPAAARAAVRLARAAGFDNLNLDLMFALPAQGLAEALEDLDAALALEPEHLSWYQLTLEPKTRFAAAPPADLPDADLAAEMALCGWERLARAGFEHYEVSAHARRGRRCRHNLNYWRFGDYLGIGAGAHGKLTLAGTPWRIRRDAKRRLPHAYLEALPDALCASRRWLDDSDRVLEFALNVLRLTEGVERGLFTKTTGLPWARIAPLVDSARADGLLSEDPERLAPSALGRDFLDDLVARFAEP